MQKVSYLASICLDCTDAQSAGYPFPKLDSWFTCWTPISASISTPHWYGSWKDADTPVSLSGHVIDCPASLTTGCTILLNIKVYLTRTAFEKSNQVNREEGGTFWQEQKETVEEEAMRKRKDALGQLFGKSRSI